MYSIVQGKTQTFLDQLNRGTKLGPFDSAGVAVGGKTLIFNDPVATVTFSGSLGDLMTPAEIISEIKAASGLGVLTIQVRGDQQGPSTSNPVSRRVYLLVTATDGFVIDSAGTANADLGLSTSVDTTNVGPVPSTQIKGFVQQVNDGVFAALLSDE